MAYQTALAALGDPTRRQIFEALIAKPQSVGALASVLPVSRPAVSQHLKVLAASGLVCAQARGTRRIYRPEPQGLAELRAYLDDLWGDVLVAFAAEVERQEGKGDG